VRGEHFFTAESNKMGIALIVHGGAGPIEDQHVAPHRDGARRAAQIGWEVLKQGGNALDAVEAAVIVMEDDLAFDAGVGSFLNCEGEVELDASLMDGRTLDAGAVAGVQRVKNAIVLARRVLESEHTFLITRGAEQFAQEQGIALIDNAELRTPEQIEIWRQCRTNPPAPKDAQYVPIQGYGTVGCVAVDRDGNVAAGTSTGGMRFKRVGRVGDSPLIGAGVYADNAGGGASSTGWGEAITRVVLAKYAVDALAGKREPREVARDAVEHLARRVGGTGGIILADTRGRIGFAFNTPRMAWAYVVEGMSEIAADC
jgi:L-asparaginase / beta-aspartyl-peptidase